MEAINTMEEFKTLINQDKPILLDFYADWCPPCKILTPTVEKLSAEYEGSVEIKKVNVDQNKELSQAFAVRSIPTLFFIKNGEVRDSLTGAVPENQIKERLETLIMN